MPVTLKYLFILCSGILIPALCSAQLKSYRFEQVDSLQKVQKRPIAVFIHTDWCQYCHGMKNTTFKDKTVINLLNSKFYFVELNAEEERNIRFNNYTFKYKPTGSKTGVHALAEQLGTINGKTAYPLTCFLNEKNDIIYQSDVFLNPKAFVEILDAVSRIK